jgi:carboxymethylenebutenolidase
LSIINQDVTLKSADGADLGAYVSRPKQEGQLPAVIVIHEAYGLNEQIRGVARRFAEEGFVAFAPHLFTRNGDIMNEKNIESAMKRLWALPPEKMRDPNAIQELMTTLPETDRKVMEIFFLGREAMENQMAQDLLDCVNYLRAQSFVNGKKLGITGFCMGGTLTYQLSTMHNFAASVPFYGANPKPLESIASIGGPILAFYAGEDERVNAGIPALVEAMLKHKKAFQMKVYKGVQHAFFNETRPVYDKESADDAWQSAIAFFRKYLAG